MSKLCWPYVGHDPKVECSHYCKKKDVCEFDDKPCDNKIGHPKTSSEYLDDGNQYVVLHRGANPGYQYTYITQIKVIAILNSRREVEEYKKKGFECGISITKVGECV